MKKKVIIGICILLAIVLLIPAPLSLKDGGTVKYEAILYQVEKIHALASYYDGKDADNDGYTEGTIVRIVGIEVYNDVE